MRKFFVFSVLLTVFYGCKKCEYVCEEKVLTSTVSVRANESRDIEIVQSNERISISFNIAYDNRCKAWFQNTMDSCNNNCGDAQVLGYINVSKLGTFGTNYYYEPVIAGCKYIIRGPFFEIEEKKIKILMERLEPYPLPGDTIDNQDYYGTFKIYQTVEICKEI